MPDWGQWYEASSFSELQEGAFSACSYEIFESLFVKFLHRHQFIFGKPQPALKVTETHKPLQHDKVAWGSSYRGFLGTSTLKEPQHAGDSLLI